nr:hypothetical protein [Tanacetum cinerariifolium]
GGVERVMVEVMVVAPAADGDEGESGGAWWRVVWWWCGEGDGGSNGGGADCGRGRRGEWRRVVASGVVDLVDRVKGSIFGVRRKSFSAPVAVLGGRGWPAAEREEEVETLNGLVEAVLIYMSDI